MNKPKDRKGMNGVSISFLDSKLYIDINKPSTAAKKIADIPRCKPNRPPITPAISCQYIASID